MIRFFPLIRGGLRTKRRNIAADSSGMALIEFAMVLPVLVILFMGSFQLMDAVSVYRKVTTTSRSIADLVTQKASIQEADLQAYLNASAQIMAPYPIDRGKFRVSLINVDTNGIARVVWSRTKDGTDKLIANSIYPLPNSVKQAGIDILVADVTYNYVPLAFSDLIGEMPFKDQIFMLSRKDNTIVII
jgi:Flp pilus assembly protein TadG